MLGPHGKDQCFDWNRTCTTLPQVVCIILNLIVKISQNYSALTLQSLLITKLSVAKSMESPFHSTWSQKFKHLSIVNPCCCSRYTLFITSFSHALSCSQRNKAMRNFCGNQQCTGGIRPGL